MQKKGLGKGLGALISGAARRWDGSPQTESDATAEKPFSGDSVIQVPLTDLIPSPMQPRKTFRDEQITELLDSIKEHGVIQPLIVRRVNGRMEIIAGERRFRASQKAGLTEVPVIVREASDRDVLELALIENLQREGLNPIEEADAYARLAREFGLKQEEIAQRVGKNRATVANSMRLLDLAEGAKNLLAQGRISQGHAKAILGLKDHALQNLFADMIVRQNLTVREVESRVAKQLSGEKSDRESAKPGKKSVPVLTSHLAKLQSKLRDKFSTHVTLTHGEKRGKIEIDYYGNDDLGRILDLLGVKVD